MSPVPCPPPGSLVRGHTRELRGVWGVVLSCSAGGDCCVLLPGGGLVTVPGWNLRVLARPGPG